jgi:hypothetical protein
MDARLRQRRDSRRAALPRARRDRQLKWAVLTSI